MLAICPLPARDDQALEARLGQLQALAQRNNDTLRHVLMGCVRQSSDGSRPPAYNASDARSRLQA